jgi:bacteriorhodopsin
MKLKFGLYLLTMVAMTLAVPWFFAAEPGAAESDGLPFWVVYSIGAAAVYATLIAICLQFFWDTSAQDDDTHGSDS